jgi:hypothetical protein
LRWASLLGSFRKLRYTASAGLPRQAVASLPKLLLEAGFDSDSIVTATKRVNLGSAEPDSALRPASAHHLDFLLELMCNRTSSPEDDFPSPGDHVGKPAIPKLDGIRKKK